MFAQEMELLKTRRQKPALALQWSGEKLDKILQNLPAMVYQFMALGNGEIYFTYINSGCSALCEIEAEKIQKNSRQLFKIIHPEDNQQFIFSLKKAIANLETWEWQGRLILPSGKIKLVQNQAHPEIQNNGTIFWDGLFIDISESLKDNYLLRKQAEIAKNESENRYQQMFNKNGAVQLIIDSESGKIIDANQSAAKFYGWELNTFKNLHIRDINVLPEEEIMLQMAKAAKGDRSYFLFLHRLANGEIKDVEVYASPVDVHSHRLIYLLIHDITDRKRAQEALRESEARLWMALNASNMGVWDLDIKTGTITCSQGMETLFGQSPGTVINSYEHLLSFLHPEDQKILEQEINNEVKQGKEYNLESRIIWPDKTIHWVAIKGIILSDRNSKAERNIATIKDITDRKKAQQALLLSEARERQKAQQLEQTLEELKCTQSLVIQNEKMVSLGQLVAGVAHEINNPINFIYGNIAPAKEYIENLLNLLHLYQENYPQPIAVIQDTIADIDLDFLVEDLPRILSSIVMGAERIRQIVLSLRNFSRLDESDNKSVNIHEGIDSTLLILQHRLKAQGGNPPITIEKEYGQLPLVQCFPGQLNQVFMNLLANAIDAVEMGQGLWENNPENINLLNIDHQKLPKIVIHTEVLNNNWVKIRISDNGPGIKEEISRRIFDPFFTTKPTGKGTGLGLSISYKIIVEKHQGKLSCASTLGEGTEFAIEIPISQKNT